MIIKAAIIEDEVPARNTIKNYLEKYFPNIRVVREIANKSEAIKQLNSAEIHLVFIDVQLKDGTGIEVLKALKQPKFKIIFTTAHDEFTLEAFKFKAFGYLLKPLNPLDFKEILNRVVKDLTMSDLTSVKIKVPLKDGYTFISSSEIIRCESDSNYTNLICTNGKSYILSKTLKYIHTVLLANQPFIRVHQTHLVNETFINLEVVSSSSISMLNGDKIPVSRANKEAVNKLFKKLK